MNKQIIGEKKTEIIKNKFFKELKYEKKNDFKEKN